MVREGHVLNRKKTQRLWGEEGLGVPHKRRKRQRLGHSTMPAVRLGATHPNHVWALDYQFDVTATGRVIKLLHVVDEFTRESLADLVDHSIDADAPWLPSKKIVGRRGSHPDFIRCDNGPELTATALRDWCRFGGSGASYIDPGSPWQNPWVESYASRVRDELLAIEQFPARSPGPDDRLAKGVQRVTSSLRPGMLSPIEFARQWRTNQPQRA
jgi:putative transposase